MWFVLCCMLTCWFMGMSAENYLNSGKLGILKNKSTLQPTVQHLMNTSFPSIVLTLDVSASMEYQERIQKLGTAVRKWILSIRNGLVLGMVEFSTGEELLSEMTLVDVTSQARLVQSIPTRGQGETCIGCGIRLALQVSVPFARSYFETPCLLFSCLSVIQVLGKRKGVMVLVTDGQNTEPGQFISNIQAEVTESGTRVVAVGLGETAPLDDLKQLASATGGLFFYISDHDGIQGLFGALQEALHLAQLMVKKTTGMTENWITKSDLPVPGTTVNSTEHPTELRNNTTSSTVPDMKHMYQPWFIFCGAAVLVVIMSLILFLVLRKRVIPVRGFYTVAKQCQSKLHTKL